MFAVNECRTVQPTCSAGVGASGRSERPQGMSLISACRGEHSGRGGRAPKARAVRPCIGGLRAGGLVPSGEWRGAAEDGGGAAKAKTAVVAAGRRSMPLTPESPCRLGASRGAASAAAEQRCSLQLCSADERRWRAGYADAPAPATSGQEDLCRMASRRGRPKRGGVLPSRSQRS